MGQDDIASEIFVVQEAASSRSVGSSSSGSIMDYGITASSTLYVLWFSNKDVQVNVLHFYFLTQMKTECVFICASSCILHVCLQEILSDQQTGAYALHPTSHSQSSLPETSTQPSLSEPSDRSAA